MADRLLDRWAVESWAHFLGPCSPHVPDWMCAPQLVTVEWFPLRWLAQRHANDMARDGDLVGGIVRFEYQVVHRHRRLPVPLAADLHDFRPRALTA